ncbi:MotA/TolQ/ExbB proton channel family protein [Frateuria aurantia]|uniref:Biopolymer transport protein ExbB n=1 Tax=Frateuria aurantia (strain ATCC 33424 / DSM 6220 / KCTC 2777 / LMG 1558 / NBRC 3245 / NCIMB 13370) TaxID=767434 RepID=H8KZ28_FRAAD|nr:MotA/TolQ/ExbB proton channel family protein [Frateuria aurantia]AFC84519.1 biopolymer transport protein [Frateuria aurantia DSM 6220]
MFQDSSATPSAPGAGTSNAAAMQQMGFDHLVHHFDAMGWIVFIVLVVMSVSSWYCIVVNAIRNTSVRARADKVISGFWNGKGQQAIQELEAQPKSEPFSKIALDAAFAAAHHQSAAGGRLAETLSRSDFVDRALRQAVARESLRLESGMTVLATVGSAAPFVGLLGTVWGIYGALIGIAASGSASMDKVAGPVGESLIMTAFGLFTAIPAVLAFNFFSRSNRLTYARFDEFAHDLHDYFATGSRVSSSL